MNPLFPAPHARGLLRWRENTSSSPRRPPSPQHHLYRAAEERGWSWFRVYCAEEMIRQRADKETPELLYLLLHVFMQAGSGHIRTDLQALEEEMPSWLFDEEGRPPRGISPLLPRQTAQKCSTIIQENPRVFQTLPQDDLRALSSPLPPFVLTSSGRFLYLLRRKRQEDRLLSLLGGLLPPRETPSPPSPPAAAAPAAALAALWQQGRRFLILAGGPGTGKTTTVAGFLELLAEDRRGAGLPPLKIALTAPTGRAAARLSEGLKPEEDRPLSVSTLHALLGIAPGRPPRRGPGRHLEAEIVIVDEASMVDLPLMNHLLEALSPRASLILIGDPHQLPSVEAGALLGDLLAGAARRDSPLGENIITLTKVYRSNTVVLQAAAAAKAGDGPALEKTAASSQDMVRKPLPPPDQLAVQLALAYRGSSEKGEFSWSSPGKVLEEEALNQWFLFYENLAVLSPLRRGLWGSVSLNQRIKEIKGKGRGIFPGMPLVINRNDKERRLSNGDRGVILNVGGFPQAVFRLGTGFRFLPPAALPPWEPAWVQTVHKSQGSEYQKVILLLPEGAGRLLTREILYTALTRAKTGVELLGSPQALTRALERQVIRNSRIQDWAAAPYSFLDEDPLPYPPGER